MNHRFVGFVRSFGVLAFTTEAILKEAVLEVDLVIINNNQNG
jgi:hypothetical protein